MLQFYWPWMALLIPLPFLTLLLARQDKSESAPEIYFPGMNRLKEAFLVKGVIPHKSQFIFFTILYLSWLFLILALMQPEKVDKYTQVTNKGYDLMLAVDISQSMEALDFSTTTKKKSRLDVTKEVVSQFVIGRAGDRVGLVTFGQNAYLHVPLTLDTLAVSKMLNDTVSGMAGSATAIGDAIGLSIKNLRERPEGSRVLVLMTDGVDNSSSLPPMEAAKLAKQYGIKIYTIGVGKNGPVAVPTQYGGYGFFEVPLDEKLLNDISQLTGGQFFRATDQKALEEIYKKIDALEKSESNHTLHLIREPLYLYPLTASFLILFFLTLKQLFFRRLANGV